MTALYIILAVVGCYNVTFAYTGQTVFLSFRIIIRKITDL